MGLVDANNDGQLDLEEFTDLITRLSGGNVQISTDPEAIQEKFNQIDENCNGFLDEEELAKAIFTIINGDQDNKESSSSSSSDSDDKSDSKSSDSGSKGSESGSKGSDSDKKGSEQQIEENENEESVEEV